MSAPERNDARDPAAITDALRQHLVEISEGKLQYDQLDPGQHLFDQGYVDSLSAVMLLAYIEETWGVEIEDTELLEGLTTLDAIAARVAQG